MSLLIFGLLASTPAATTFAEDEEHERCMRASGGVTVEMLDCIGAAYERADEALNALWNRRTPQLTGETGELLHEAQRRWIAYRDSTCAAEAAAWGEGSFSSVELADCRLRITRERLDWLDRVLLREDGDERGSRDR